jgi:hypothetical protein
LKPVLFRKGGGGVCDRLFYGRDWDEDRQKVNDDAGLPDDAIDEWR